MSTPRQSLYQRLPEIYHIEDEKQHPPYQLRALLDVLDPVFAGIRDNIEHLYHDLFIETCDEWVIPYIADLLGTSHLTGDVWTRRADVARTVHHRRRKGTLGAIESLTYVLSGWAVHTVELRERLLWNQHLNHQRPDAGGPPPLQPRPNVSDPSLRYRSHISEAVRGGTVALRDPAVLSFMGRPFGTFARVVDVKPVDIGAPRYNLPNLAIFLWRLKDYTVPGLQPVCTSQDLTGSEHDADYAVRCLLHPLGEPMVLFNAHRFRADEDPPNLANEDAVPGPIAMARLTEATVAGCPEKYVSVETYTPGSGSVAPAKKIALTLHVPDTIAARPWHFRGANLCGWEAGLAAPLGTDEIVIDPDRGRVLFGLADSADAQKLADHLLASPTYGFSGPTGAHPVPRKGIKNVVQINAHDPASPTLQNVLANIHNRVFPVVVEIQDSMTHTVTLANPMRLKGVLHLRAASGQRPVIRLGAPLRFRPFALSGLNAVTVEQLNVTLEGLYLSRTETYTGELIAQAAVNRLLIEGCTVDPSNAIELDGTPHGTRKPTQRSLHLDHNFGFSGPSDAALKKAFKKAKQIPEIILYRTISGPLAMDDNYELTVAESIIDAGSGPSDPNPALAICAATGDPEVQWGPPLTVRYKYDPSSKRECWGLTSFGRMRVFRATGQGGIWLHRLEVHDNQYGCIKFSYFSGENDRLPPNHGCVFGTDAIITLGSEVFGQSGYAQLRLRSDRRLLEQGPGRDAMGAFGYLQNTHKWKNINIRYREFMPVGVRPVLIPVT